jgi:hypothetical protein
LRAIKKKWVGCQQVSINTKGGDCWHVYKKSVLVIDGKNNNNDEKQVGKEDQQTGRQGISTDR